MNRADAIVRNGWLAVLGLAAAAAMVMPIPAAAQFMGPSYKFLEAIKKKDGEAVEKALGEGGPNLINTKDVTSGDTALHLVTARRDLAWMSFLIYKGGNVNARNEKGATPLSLAVGLGFVEGVDLLLGNGARVNDPGVDGETPLIAAVHQRSIELVRTMIKAGADPRRADNSGRTALDYARLIDKDSVIAGELDAAAKAVAARQKRTYGPSF
ncbi:MAG: ankyrin repeat domain-containing protein [Pseudomonadota bacterium]